MIRIYHDKLFGFSTKYSRVNKGLWGCFYVDKRFGTEANIKIFENGKSLTNTTNFMHIEEFINWVNFTLNENIRRVSRDVSYDIAEQKYFIGQTILDIEQLKGEMVKK